MRKIFKIYNITNIDMDTIKSFDFKESLLRYIPKIHLDYKYLNSKLHHLVLTPRIKGMSTMEQYNSIVELIITKNRLVVLQDLFNSWFKKLPEKLQELYIAYYVNNDRKTCVQLGNNTHYYDRNIAPMVNSFMSYVKRKSDLTEKDLIEIPYIYDAYLRTLHKNEKRQSRLNIDKGETTYDNTANERCYC